MRGNVEHAAADAHARGADVGAVRRRRAAQHALDARGELARVEWLRHVIVGADLEAHDAIDDGRGGREHDDRDLGVALAQVARETQAVFAGHVDVDQRQVDRMLRGERLRGARVFRADDRVAVGGEVLVQYVAYFRLVIDNQYRGFRAHARL